MNPIAHRLALLVSLPLMAATAGHAAAQDRPDPAPAAPPHTQTAPAQPPQDQSPQDQPPPQTQAQASPDDETSPPRKWPPFGLALGGGIRVTAPTGDSTSTFTTPTPVARFVPRAYRSGLVPAIRLGLGKQRTTLLETSGAGGQTEVGSVYVRPLTLGLGWSQRIAHRTSIVFSGSAGYSWNGFDATDNGRGHPQLLLPTTVVSISNSFAWELSSRAWYDLNSRVSLLGGISFLSTHPDLTLADGSIRSWNANQIRIEAGIAFTVLKPLQKNPRRR